VLERLQSAETDLLFAYHPLIQLESSRGGQIRASTSSWAVTNLNAFITWVNDYCAERGRNDGIPSVNGRPWRLTTPQFRRTLAWFIARRPGGSIAGAIAYRHTAQFNRWRTDREPRSCTYAQLEQPLSFQLDDIVPGLGSAG
jgi:hypothetical protein